MIDKMTPDKKSRSVVPTCRTPRQVGQLRSWGSIGAAPESDVALIELRRQNSDGSEGPEPSRKPVVQHSVQFQYWWTGA